MSPPNLATNAPVLNVFQPLCVYFFPMRRNKSDKMLAHNQQRLLRFRVTQKPLLADARLDRHFAAFAEADIVFIRLGLGKQSATLQ